MQIFATKDNGRIHIAVEQHYQGSINSYNNWLTRFFTKLLRYSIDVTIAGKTRCLNIKSYVKFLQKFQVTGASVATIGKFKDFNALYFIPKTDEGFMRDHLQDEKKDRLAYKFSKALYKSNEPLALKALGKGAALNLSFWTCAYNDSVVMGEDFVFALPHRKIDAFEATQYTPFLYAAHKSNKEMMTLLNRYGADQTQKGTAYTFTRELVETHTNTSLNPTVRYHHRHGRHGRHRHGHYDLGMDMTTSVVTSYRDTYNNPRKLIYDVAQQRVFVAADPEKRRVHDWSEEDEVSSFGVY